MNPQEKLLLECSRFRVHEIDVVDGNGRTRSREVIRHPGAVVLLPILGDGRVVMIENHRHSVGETLLELPAGTIDPGETPADTAGRELIEETGYRAGDLTQVLEFFSCPGICDELMRLFVATDLTAGEPDREATEEIENRIVSFAEVRTMISAGKIRDAKTLVGLFYWIEQTSGGG